LILGGGGLALFGTGNLHTWAASVDEIYKRFTDTQKIDRSKFMDDSAYRLVTFCRNIWLVFRLLYTQL